VGMIFPLTTPGRIVFILIAIVLGLIWSMFMWPNLWRKMLGKKQQSVPPPQSAAPAATPVRKGKR
jgi:hypothetical protein